MNKIQILFFLFLISFYLGKELNLDFLNYKTNDTLRQITWSSIELIPDEAKKLYEKKDDVFFQERNILIKRINKTLTILLNKTHYSKEELINMIEENKVFKIEKEADIDQLIDNENIPKNFLINFAFNIDKYSRTENQEINGAMDYINYLTRNDLKKFLFQKLNEFPHLKSPDNFKKYILNDINFNFPDIDAYCKSKSEKELIQFIYGFEKYCFSEDNSRSEYCSLPYRMYNHDSLDSYTKEDLRNLLLMYSKKVNINNLDNFIVYIENRNFSYINAKQLFPNIMNELIENVKAFETYFNKQNNISQSLSKRDEYINHLNPIQLKEILEWAVDLYPELNERVRFKDIISNQINLQYGQVKEYLRIKEREVLLKYASNIHTFQHNITSKYEEHIINFIRLNDERLYRQIFLDTNDNILLQEKTNFDYYASLFKDSIKEYLKSLQRNQLKVMTKKIYNIIQRGYQDGQALSKKKNLFDSIENMSDEDLLKTSFMYVENAKINNIFNLIERENDYYYYNYTDEEVSFYNLYFYNIMDFFRSTDINYLRLWLRKYELEIRKLSSKRHIAGGLKNNFMKIAEYSKKEILKVFDIYVYEYPELFYPEKFIKITGLDNGITPHKYLVENRNNSTIMEKILFSIVAHMQIKNIQINFHCNEYLANFFGIQDLDDNDINSKYFRKNFIYSVFRIINIFPELNNMLFFEKLCLNDKTRVLHLYQIEEIFKTNRDLAKIAENIKYFNGMTNSGIIRITKEKNSEQENIQVIKDFISLFSPEETKIKVIHGDFYSLLYDFSLFLKEESEIVINNTYDALSDDNRLIGNYNPMDSKENKVGNICIAINTYKELQDIEYFDSRYNYINFNKEYNETIHEIYNYLNKTNNRQLFYYCILANLIKIDYQKEANSINKIPDIYLKIHSMSRNSMIRYILNIASFDNTLKNKLSETNLRKLTKKYMLDLGSDNVYDLTMY